MPPFDIVRPLPDLVAANAARRGAATAYADEHESITFARLADRTARLAGVLADLDVRPFDRVAVVLDGGVGAAVAHLAIARASAIAVPLDPATAPDELAARLAASGVSVAFAGSWLRGIRPRLTLVPTTTEPVSSPRDDAGLDDLAVLLGPRGALHSQRGVLWQAAAGYATVAGLAATAEIHWSGPVTGAVGYGLCVAAATALGTTVRFTATAAGVPDVYATDEAGVIAMAWQDGGGLLPVPGVCVRVVTADGTDADVGQEGEVLVSGPGVMAGGYLDAPDATAAALDGGWCRTGDLARRDEHGVLTRTGRVADILVSHGERVRLPEVAAVLAAVPGVTSAEASARDDVLVCHVRATDDAVRVCRRRLTAFRVPVELHVNGEPVVTPHERGQATGAASGALRTRLAREPVARQRELLLELVLAEAAEVVADQFGALVAADQPFKQLGFDSLGAVRLRNRLTAATGVDLPATVAFDYPLPTALATHLWARLCTRDTTEVLDRVAALAAELEPTDDVDPLVAGEVTGRLRRLLTAWEDRHGGGRDLTTVTAEDMFALLENEL